MGIEQQVESARTALTILTKLIHFSHENLNSILKTKSSLLDKILVKEWLSEEQYEDEIAIAFTGILVVALSMHQSQYAHLKDNRANLSPYLWDERGNLTSPYYPKQAKEVLAISAVDASERDNEDPDVYQERLVLAVGTKVMNGELPFQAEILNAIVKKHQPDAYRQYLSNSDNHFRDQARQVKFNNNLSSLRTYITRTESIINSIYRYYYSSTILCQTSQRSFYGIEAGFNGILNRLINVNDTPEKEKFIEGLVALKQATLASFQKEEANFGYDDCATIIRSVSLLAQKVGLNSELTQADVKEFTKATQKYKTSHTFEIALAVIIGAAIGMIGGAAGFIVVGGIAGVSSTMWYTKKEPLNKISSAATEMLPSL